MLAFAVETPQRSYQAIVERGLLRRIAEHIPPKTGKIFIVTTHDVWKLYGEPIAEGLKGHDVHRLFFPGGEERKRLSEVEMLASEMLDRGGDRSSLVIAFGGGIVNDLGGFLASMFMRGIPVLQIPTTLLAQVDAAIGGKTGVNLPGGKNMLGAFHQPLAVLIDPDVLGSLPEREFRAGLYEIVKAGVIRSVDLFRVMSGRSDAIIGHDPDALDYIIGESVRIKAEVVTADEREGDLRRILNFGHTIGHALEAETSYRYYLHGEAVAVGMRAATHLAKFLGLLPGLQAAEILSTIDLYGPVPDPPLSVTAERLVARTIHDKKTLGGRVHFVLPNKIGSVRIVTDVDPQVVTAATQAALDNQ